MTLWRTTYRDRQDKAANKGTVTALGLVYVYAVEVEG